MKLYKYKSVIESGLEFGMEEVNKLAKVGWRVCGFTIDDVLCYWTPEREVKSTKPVKSTHLPSHGMPRGGRG